MGRKSYASATLAAALVVLAGCTQPEQEDVAAVYVGSETCESCHAEEAAAWERSHHYHAMRPVSESRADFDADAARGDGFRFESTASGPVLVDEASGDAWPVTHRFGLVPLHQFLVLMPDGRLQVPPVAVDTRPGKGHAWFPVYDEDAPTWNSYLVNWNLMCADCHSTNLVKGFDASTNTYDTRFAELNVGCEACHGPASKHVENGAPLAALNEQSVQVDTCARCHSRRAQLAEGFTPGDDFLDYYQPALLDEGLYHADGQILDEVYVYGSFLQSRMHEAGVVCSDCHEPHSARLARPGNETCTACHAEGADTRFPTLKAVVYDTPEHHFHREGSAGALCVSCHMPATTYMQVDPRRDHSFRVPRPDLTQTLGVPNACNACHTDRDAQWAADEIRERFGDQRVTHPAEWIANARGLTQTPLEPTTSPSVLGTVAALNLDAELIMENTLHSESLVRMGAARASTAYDPLNRWALVNSLLEDPVLAVRTEASRALAPLLLADLPQSDYRRLNAATREYEDTLQLSADRPEGLTQLGLLETYRSKSIASERYFQRALAFDPGYVPAAINLADLYRSLDRDNEAEVVLRATLEHSDEPALHYSYGLTLVRLGRPELAVSSLGRAARGMPGETTYRYAYAVALNSTDQTELALKELRDTLETSPDAPQILFLLAAIHRDRAETEPALEYVRRLLELDPTNRNALLLLRELSQE